jgi:hypothetical protein
LIIQQQKVDFCSTFAAQFEKSGCAVLYPETTRKELFDLAFDKRIAMTNDLVVVEATAASGCSPVRLTPAV